MEESETKDIPETDSTTITIELDYDRTVIYAMQQNDVPVECACQNDDDGRKIILERFSDRAIFSSPRMLKLTSPLPSPG